MKNFAIYLMLFVLWQLFIGYGENEFMPKVEFSLSDFNQMGWKSGVIINNTQETHKVNMDILYFTEKLSHDVISETDTKHVENSIHGKLMVILGVQSSDLDDNWMMLEFNENELNLKCKLWSEIYNKTLALSRIYSLIPNYN